MPMMTCGRRGTSWTIVLASVVATGGLLFVAAPGAHATVPGINGRIAFVRSNTIVTRVLSVAPDGTNITGPSYMGGNDYGVTYSPDGKQMVFVRTLDGDAELVVAKADGSNVTKVTNNTVDDRSPTWSPDGTKIAFVRGDGPDNIFVMPATGGKATNLSKHLSYYSELDWSPTADAILYEDSSGQLFTIPSIPQDAEPTPTQVTSITGYDSPSWSPDGTQIAATRLEEVYRFTLAEPDSPVLLSIAGDSRPDTSPVWSPDGTKIAYAHNASSYVLSQDIWIMNATDGANKTPLVTDDDADWPSSWAASATAPCTIGGTAASETIVGTEGDDVICGGGGDDRLQGLGGNDILRGGSGMDVLVGGDGNDQLEGERGIDTASFEGGTAVSVDLALGTATGVGSDTLGSVENLLGSNGGDNLRGDGENNRIAGALGDDLLVGRGGNDRLFGGDGDDTLNGGNGNDACKQGPGTGTVTACE
jgi:Ca2+-binding RTX toxin-like protein